MKPAIFTILAASLLLQACATAPQPVSVQLKYTPGDNRQISPPKGEEKVNLQIAQLDISDNRVDKDHLGSTDVPIYGFGITDWVRGGFLSLSAFGYSFPQANAGANPSGLALKVNINRTSCRGTLMHMRCTVLMEVEYLSGGKLIQKAQYYGAEMDDRSIWVGTSHFGEDSVLQSLNSALDQCLIKIEGDLRKLRQSGGANKGRVSL